MAKNTMAERQNFFDGVHHPEKALLQIERVACTRGLRRLFEGLSHRLGAAQALAIYGPNGSGKTSLLRQIAGFLPCDEGQIDRQHIDTHFLGHADGLKATLSLDETLHFETLMHARALLPHKPTEMLSQLGLGGAGAHMVGDLSAGQRRRLALAKLIVAPRALWLLDEPLTALDETGRDLIATMAKDHLAANGMIIAASHTPLAFADQQIDLAKIGAA